MDIRNDLPPIHITWIESHVFSILHPERDLSEAIYIKGKDLSRLREWLEGGLGSSLPHQLLPLRFDPNNIYENMVLIFPHDGPGSSSYKNIVKYFAAMKLSLPTEQNYIWRKNFPEDKSKI